MPQDSNKLVPGSCDDGEVETDSDSDRFPDRIDECPQDRKKDVPGVCGCGIVDSDSDSNNDGVLDCHDGCPNIIDKTVSGLCVCGGLALVNTPKTLQRRCPVCVVVE